jgi:glutamyl-tRNA synthetase
MLAELQGPYRQSERGQIYLDVIEKLKASGHLYESYLSAEEIEERNKAAGRAVQLGYDNSERELSEAERERYIAEGRKPALRLKVPAEDITFTGPRKGRDHIPGR